MTTTRLNIISKGPHMCLCKCECGKVCAKKTSDVISGKVKSCGCLITMPWALTEGGYEVKRQSELGISNVYKNKNGSFVAKVRKKHLVTFDNINDAIVARDNEKDRIFRNYSDTLSIAS